MSGPCGAMRRSPREPVAGLLPSLEPLVPCRLPRAGPLHGPPSPWWASRVSPPPRTGRCRWSRVPPARWEVRPQVRGRVCFVSGCAPRIRPDSGRTAGARRTPGGRTSWSTCCWVWLSPRGRRGLGGPGPPGFPVPKRIRVSSNLSTLITLNALTSTIDQLIALTLLVHHL